MAKLRILIILTLLFSKPTSAIELGRLRIDSFLNEPLNASIEIHDVDEYDLADIKFSLGGHGDYKKLLGSPRPSYLDKLRFNIGAVENNRYELQITSTRRAIEPIITVLVKVSEKQSIFIKKFTLLMDPKIDSVQPLSEVSKPVALAIVETPVQDSDLVAATDPADSRTIIVGDRSISIIAQNSSLHERFSVYQIMRAFYRENPQAFENGNIDKLISGSSLVVPSETQIGEVPRQAAINFVYSVSKDKSEGSDANTRVASTGLVLAQPAITPVSQSRVNPQQASAQSSAKLTAVEDSSLAFSDAMQRDLQSWRNLADEFASISGMLESQNRAMAIQNGVLQSMSDNLKQHEQQIRQLRLRLDQMAAIEPGGASDAGTRLAAEPSIIAEQESLIGEQENSIASINRKLAAKDNEISKLKSELATLSETRQARLQQRLPEPETAQQPDALIANPANEIVETEAQDSGNSTGLWITLAVIAATLVFLLREWFWHRRISSVASVPTAKKKTSVEPNRPSTYQSSRQDTGNIELRDLDVEQKAAAKSTGIIDKSSVRLESHTIDEVKIEIDLLLAYEQYPEALQLVDASRGKFGDDPWLDIKELEVLGSYRQCDEFFACFNRNKERLEKELPDAWKEIEDIRKHLREEFKISAVQ